MRAPAGRVVVHRAPVGEGASRQVCFGCPFPSFGPYSFPHPLPVRALTHTHTPTRGFLKRLPWFHLSCRGVQVCELLWRPEHVGIFAVPNRGAQTSDSFLFFFFSFFECWNGALTHSLCCMRRRFEGVEIAHCQKGSCVLSQISRSVEQLRRTNTGRSCVPNVFGHVSRRWRTQAAATATSTARRTTTPRRAGPGRSGAGWVPGGRDRRKVRSNWGCEMRCVPRWSEPLHPLPPRSPRAPPR